MHKWLVVLALLLPSCGSSQLSILSTPNVETTNNYTTVLPPRPPPVTRPKVVRTTPIPTGERINERTKPPAR